MRQISPGVCNSGGQATESSLTHAPENKIQQPRIPNHTTTRRTSQPSTHPSTLQHSNDGAYMQTFAKHMTQSCAAVCFMQMSHRLPTQNSHSDTRQNRWEGKAQRTTSAIQAATPPGDRRSQRLSAGASAANRESLEHVGRWIFANFTPRNAGFSAEACAYCVLLNGSPRRRKARRGTPRNGALAGCELVLARYTPPPGRRMTHILKCQNSSETTLQTMKFRSKSKWPHS